MTPIQVRLERVDACTFEATDALGNRMRVAGSAELAAQIRERVPDPSVFPSSPLPPLESTGPGFRPMALFLVSLAGCSVLDLVLILARQRQDVRGVTVLAEGIRVEATPAPYEKITLRFIARGPVSPDALTRAAELAVQKYCSVEAMLRRDITVTIETELVP